MKKLKVLDLSCNVRVWLPMILCFSSLESLTLSDEGHNFSSAKPFSLSELLNLRALTLKNCTSLGSSLPELPLNLECLHVHDHTSLEQLPDLSSLKQLKWLYIKGCSSLQSISLLPSHLRTLSVQECTSLQDLPDLSMLKELVSLRFTQCSNLKSISLKQSSLEVGQSHHLPFTADLPNREVAEWFNYKASGSTVSFDLPLSFGSNFLGLALWVVYTCNATLYGTCMRAVITNSTQGITKNYDIDVHAVVGEAQSRVECITGEWFSMKSGDRIKVSIDKVQKGPIGEVTVKMLGAHVIQKTLSPVTGLKRYRSEDDPADNSVRGLIQDQVSLNQDLNEPAPMEIDGLYHRLDPPEGDG